jgi:inward rectifier potassium channel
MSRIVNARKNALIDLDISLLVTFLNPDNRMMQFLPLRLERSTIYSLALSWTIVHPIDEESPLFNFTQKDFEDIDLQLILSIKAFDESYSQTVHSKVGYVYNDILWGKKFVPMYERSEDGGTKLLHLEKINEMVKVSL